MDREDLKFILQEGEGHKIEFKERLSGLDREMVAFANAQGGRIFLGINDDNQIVWSRAIGLLYGPMAQFACE